MLTGATGEKGINIPDNPHPEMPLIFNRSVALVKVIAQPETVPFQCPSWVKLKWEDNHYEAKAEWLESLNRSIVGYHHIEWVHQQSSSSINAYEIAWSAWDFIKNRSNLKGAAKTLAIERISPVLFSQSNFRGHGDYVLNFKDVTEGQTFEDSIALGRSPMDKGMTLLSSSRGKYALAQPFEIPLRSLYSNKIRNLLWAGEHASVSHEVAPCLSFPPTAAQLGVVTGHVAAHCIAKRRQPRTIAKKGHVDEVRKSLELIDHRTGLVQFNDETDLIGSSLVKSSSF